MFTERLRRLSYGWLVLQGLAAAVAPKGSIDLNVKLWGFPFENTDELEPKDWYVRMVRATGLGMLTAGVAGLVLEGRASERDADTADDTDDDQNGSPVDVDA